MNQDTDRPDFNRQAHWQGVYSKKKSTELSWCQQYPERLLKLIKATGVDPSASIIDIGRRFHADGASQSFVYCRFVRV